MNTSVAKDLDHPVRGAVEHLRMFREVRSGVDEALELDDAPDPIEAAEFELDGCKDVESRKARECVAILGDELPAQPSLGRSALLRERAFARNEEQVAGLYAVGVIRTRIAGGRKLKPEFAQSVIDLHCKTLQELD